MRPACPFDTTGAQVIERVAFDEAVRPVIADHPTVPQAAAGVLRAQANALADRL